MWFRRDLRLADNPAWAAATRSGAEVVPVFVLEPALIGAAGPRRWSWIAANLRALDDELAAQGGRLLVVEGPAEDVLTSLMADAHSVHWNADYTPFSTRRDAGLAARLDGRVVVHHGGVVHPPDAVLKDDGSPYRVFTPFWNRWRRVPWATWNEPVPVSIASDPGIGVPDAPTPPPFPPGARAAAERLDAFVDRLERYPDERDRPDLDSTSRLSADLKAGTLDARRVRDAVGEDTAAGESFIRQLAWRDFYAALLASDPASVSRAWNPRYRTVRWREDDAEFAAWASGSTGYPIVDAGMRELLATGFMHNRVRMIVASFLVKDLQLDWRLGERHFRRHLIDADVASNVGNWQWVAGTGADAAPYFRVFNPVTQGERHDPAGNYVRRWVPELGGVPARYIHRPWEMPPLELAAAGVTLGVDYPVPLVDHAEARVEAIARYKRALGE